MGNRRLLPRNRAIAIGSRAYVFVMAGPERRISGTVEGVGWGVRSEDSATILGIPIVSDSLSWVRVAKRFLCMCGLKIRRRT
ncbi:hypothetical protein IB277_29215 [Ensifer sp. ENS07]|jgi:multidrug efflux system membrane fusion protein|uniref:Uncharacterized protein n=1 Tax=Ensifer adhaerens TaxID=106592 RepID=A0A9Q9DBK2_ENSAD|nr:MULTISPECIES: hypothetical protein [Ensifer]MBD9640384.1 hypothetical protein [Ensifer sp. ENS07]USJ25434.1 hypothetical protein NE863_23315 [Ensifer adhaerens]UTV39117.1 hypothetical protein MYG64_25600 [Ensifer adhaerens]